MYYGRRPPPQRKPEPPRAAPLPAQLIDEFHDRELGSGGEMLPVPEPAPPAPPVMPLVIEPPDWEAEAAERGPQPPPSPYEGMTALQVLKMDDTGFEPEPWRPPAPPMEPLVPWKPPEPDWRQEELERAQRDRKPPVLDEPEKSLRRWPA